MVLVQDCFFGDRTPELPHTIGSMKTPFPDRAPRWRFDYVRIPKEVPLKLELLLRGKR